MKTGGGGEEEGEGGFKAGTGGWRRVEEGWWRRHWGKVEFGIVGGVIGVFPLFIFYICNDLYMHAHDYDCEGKRVQEHFLFTVPSYLISIFTAPTLPTLAYSLFSILTLLCSRVIRVTYLHAFR